MAEFTPDRRQLLRACGAGLLGAAGLAPAAAGVDESAWTFETGGAVTAPPTVVDGTVYVGSQNGTVYALSTDGERLWTVDTGGPVRAAPTVVDGLAVVGGMNGLYGLSATRGETLWHRDRVSSSTPTVADGRVFYGTGFAIGWASPAGSVYALHAGSGREQWRFEAGESGALISAPTVVDDTVYVGGSHGRLHALSADGSQEWAVELEGEVSSPTVADGRVYVGSAGRLSAFAPAGGDPLWHVDIETSAVSMPTVADGAVFAVARRERQERERVHALSTAGDPLWTVDTGEWLSRAALGRVASPTVVDGIVFVASSDGRVYGLSAESGEQVWVFEAGARIATSPTVVDGTVYVGDADGQVYALDVPVEGSSEDSRVLLGTLGHHGAWADQAPTALFDYEPGNPAAGDPVTVDATPSVGDIAGYEWTFGDGGRAAGVTVTHAFETAGSYEATLTVADTSGETATATQTVPVHPSLAWTADTAEAVTASPTVVDDTVYVGDTDGRMYALDTATGIADWEYAVGGPVRGAPSVVDGTVYAGAATADGGEVYGLSTEGEHLWTAAVEGAPDVSPTVVDGTVVVGTRSGIVTGGDGARRTGVCALDAGSGMRRWSFDTGGVAVSSATVVDGVVYVGATTTSFELGGDAGRRLYALDLASGTEEWSVATDRGVRSAPTVVDDTVYVGTGSFPVVGSGGTGSVVALSTDGEHLWTLDTDGSVQSSPTVADGTVYVGSGGGVYALSTGGEHLWTVDIDGPVQSSPTVVDGVVYVGSDEGVYALSTDGEHLWTVDTDGPVQSSPTVVDGVVYVGSDEGVYALDAPVEGSSEDSRVLLGTLGHHGAWADQAPTALFDYEPRNPVAGDPVTVDSTPSVGDITGYEWRFADGSVAAGETATHVFEEPGRREVTLTAATADGDSTVTTRDLRVAPETHWAFETSEPVRSPPTVVDGVVYVGSERGLYALDTQDVITDWFRRAADGVDAAPAAVDDIVFVTATISGGSGVHALSAGGERLWTVGADGLSSPTVVDGVVYVGSDEGQVYALAGVSGGELWSVDVGSGVGSPPTVVDGTVYVGTADGGVSALDTVDGDDLWRSDTGNQFDGRGVAASPTVAAGTVVAETLAGTVHAFDAGTGEELWTAGAGDEADRTEPADLRESAPTIADGTVFTGRPNGTVHALSLADGKRVWRARLDGQVACSPTVAGDTVVIGDHAGTVHALSTDTGRTQWTVEVNGAVASSPTAADGVVYVGDGGGTVHALGARSGSSRGSRVMLGTLGHHGTWRYAGQSIDAIAGSGDDTNGDDTTGEPDGDDGSGPGLGPATALAGLAGAGYLLGRSRHEDTTDRG